jgi:hypothetical protein
MFEHAASMGRAAMNLGPVPSLIFAAVQIGTSVKRTYARRILVLVYM